MTALTGGGAVGGAVVAYFLDPKNGKRRRRAVRERAVALWRRAEAAQPARDSATSLTGNGKKNTPTAKSTKGTGKKTKSPVAS